MSRIPDTVVPMALLTICRLRGTVLQVDGVQVIGDLPHRAVGIITGRAVRMEVGEVAVPTMEKRGTQREIQDLLRLIRPRIGSVDHRLPRIATSKTRRRRSPLNRGNSAVSARRHRPIFQPQSPLLIAL